MRVMLNNMEGTGDPEKRNLTEVWLKGFKTEQKKRNGDKCSRISCVL